MQELNCFPWWCASLFLWPQLYLSACVSVVGPLAIHSLRLPLVGCCGYDPFWIENANKSALATPRRRSFSNRRGSILYNNHLVKQKTIQKQKTKNEVDDDDGNEAKRFRTIWTAANVFDDVTVNLQPHSPMFFIGFFGFFIILGISSSPADFPSASDDVPWLHFMKTSSWTNQDQQL